MKILIGIITSLLIVGGGYFAYNNFAKKDIAEINNQKQGIVQKNNEKIDSSKLRDADKKLIDSSWDLDEDGINDCEKDNSCDDSIDYSLPKETKDLDKKEDEKKVFEVPETILILDGSGSMWGKINNKPKIEIAKKVVKDTVVDFENDMKLGLMVYGHNRKDDCKDIELLSEPALANAKNISKIVDEINPKGMTPMGDSVMQAAEFLKYKEKKATVVLVSDGIETCGVDLCALGKKLEETGIDFTAHVIGFGMTKKQTVGLKCLADETGGEFVSASDSKSLSDALKEAIEKSSCSKEKLGEAIFTIPEKVNANSKFEIKWAGVESKKDDAIGIFKKGETNWNRHLDSESYLNIKNGKIELLAPTEVGEYEVIYFADCGSILGRKSFKVEDVEAKINFVDSVVAGSEVSFSWKGPNNRNDYIAIFKKGETNWNRHLASFSYLDSKDGIGKIRIPTEVGEYEITYWLGSERVLTRKSFLVTEATAKFLEAPTSVNRGEKFTVKWNGPNIKGDAITILPKNSTNWNDHIGGSIYYLNSKNGEGVATAPDKVGIYEVVYWLQQEKILARKSFEVIN